MEISHVTLPVEILLRKWKKVHVTFLLRQEMGYKTFKTDQAAEVSRTFMYVS